jgi:hypothetical protein
MVIGPAFMGNVATSIIALHKLVFVLSHDFEQIP